MNVGPFRAWRYGVLAAGLVTIGSCAQRAQPEHWYPQELRCAQLGMMRMHQKIVALRAQAREHMILILTPEHRASYADIIGRLVLDPQPNVATAAQQIDALLSPDERNAVVAVAAQERVAEHATLLSGRARCGTPVTADELRNAMRDQDLATDAGAELMRIALSSLGGSIGGEPRR